MSKADGILLVRHEGGYWLAFAADGYLRWVPMWVKRRLVRAWNNL